MIERVFPAALRLAGLPIGRQAEAFTPTPGKPCKGLFALLRRLDIEHFQRQRRRCQRGDL
ncbi:Uncharacterised protein [Kluyvera intermedia]|jgi:hypothetical protein|nr:Uncharacterised protein [Kluyvera intermedia]